MRAVLFCILLLLPVTAFPQLENVNLQSMVNAERAFAAMAKDKNTRDAFLFYLSDEAVTANAYGPVVGKSALKKSAVNAGLLSWDVSYCDIASSGDFGYDTGPWEFRNDRADENAVAFGEFHSVWRKESDGSWKNIVDIGIRHPASSIKPPLSTSNRPLKLQNQVIPAVTAIVSLMDAEKTFLAAYKKKGLASYNDVASPEIRFAREGEQPIITPKERITFLKGPNSFYNPALVDGGIASSGDMGYVYGTADAILMIDNKQQTKRATYLRIWKKEEAKNWKIVLDVMSFQ